MHKCMQVYVCPVATVLCIALSRMRLYTWPTLVEDGNSDGKSDEGARLRLRAEITCSRRGRPVSVREGRNTSSNLRARSALPCTKASWELKAVPSGAPFLCDRKVAAAFLSSGCDVAWHCFSTLYYSASGRVGCWRLWVPMKLLAAHRCRRV